MIGLKQSKVYLWALLLALSSANAGAQDLVLERAILEDPSGQMSLAQVQGATFTPTGPVTARTFDRSVFWLRLSVNAAPTPEPLALTIRPALVDTLTLFTPPLGAASDWTATDLSLRSAQAQTLLNLAPGPHTVYLRVDTKGVLMQAGVLTQRDLNQQNHTDHVVLGGVLTSYVLMILTLLSLRMERQGSLKYFLLFHLLVCLLSYLNLNGLLDRSFADPADWMKKLARPLAALNFVSFLLLIQSFFGFWEMPRVKRSVGWLLGCCLLLVAFVYAVEPQQAYRLSTFGGACVLFALNLGLIAAALKFVVRASLRQWPQLIFSGVLLLLFITVSWAMLQLMGVLQAMPLLFDIQAYRSLFFFVCLLTYLWIDDSEKSHAIERSQTALAAAASLVALRTQRLETQKAFMAMLMHELKTPLNTIQLAAFSLSRHSSLPPTEAKRLDNINRSADDINFIIDRCVQADEIEHSELPVSKSPVVVSTLMRELAQLPGQERLSVTGLLQSKVIADYRYLRIILLNLVTNALKYSTPDNMVKVAVEATPYAGVPSLCFRVSNTVGRAGRPDPLKVFTRYYRTDGAKKEAGTGLGLWLAHTFALKMGAQLQCSSDDSMVHFYFSLERC